MCCLALIQETYENRRVHSRQLWSVAMCELWNLSPQADAHRSAADTAPSLPLHV